MRVLVCGDRNWSRPDLVFWNVQRVFCENYDNDPVLIEGEARGADTHGRLAAEKLKIPVLKFPANWAKHGKAAGPRAKKAGIPVEVITVGGPGDSLE